MTLPIHRFLNFVLAWCFQQMDPEKKDQWMEQLEDPLPWQKRNSKVTASQIEKDGASFFAAMSNLQGG